MHADTVWNSRFPTDVWKAEYNAVLSNSLPAGSASRRVQSLWARDGKVHAPRVEDIGNNFVSGGVWHRPRPSPSAGQRVALSYSKSGWGGNHNFKLGSEIMRDCSSSPFTGFRDASNALSLLNNGAPTQVDVYQSPSESQNGL